MSRSRLILVFIFGLGQILVLVFLVLRSRNEQFGFDSPQTGARFNLLSKYVVRPKLQNLSYAEVQEHIRIQEELLRRGRAVELGEEEIKLTLKYWELIAWFKNLSSGVPEETAPPAPYRFGTPNLWGPEFQGAPDKILAQEVWRMQLLIGNSIRTHYRAENGGQLMSEYEAHTLDVRPKRIFIGNMKMWPDWTLLPRWGENGRVSGCYEEILPEQYAHLEPTCELTQAQPDWNDIDLIVQLNRHNPFESNSTWRIVPPKEHESVPWFRYTLEAPFTHPQMAMNPTQFFNSYWSGSPVQQKYMKWIYFDPNTRAREREPGTDVDYSAGKTRVVAMLTSNCQNLNGRLDYARELGKYVDVDIYGKCGESCGDSTKPEECFKILQEYKFYLAFENSNCQEYVTEKLHRNAFRNNIVPIVMGASPSFYRLHAPQNSYIHVQDFETPQALATYLRVVAANSTMYNAYFQWKGTGQVLREQGPWLCSVCALLYQGSLLAAQGVASTSQVQWIPKFNVNGQPLCLRKGQWYW